jgi:hypothetical protein
MGHPNMLKILKFSISKCDYPLLIYNKKKKKKKEKKEKRKREIAFSFCILGSRPYLFLIKHSLFFSFSLFFLIISKHSLFKNKQVDN